MQRMALSSSNSSGSGGRSQSSITSAQTVATQNISALGTSTSTNNPQSFNGSGSNLPATSHRK